MSSPRRSTEAHSRPDEPSQATQSALSLERSPMTGHGKVQSPGDGDGQHEAHAAKREERNASVPAHASAVNAATADSSVPNNKTSEGRRDMADETNQEPMGSSTATLKPGPVAPSPSQALPPLKTTFLNMPPHTAAGSQETSQSTSSGSKDLLYTPSLEPQQRSPTRSDAGFDEKTSASEDEREHSSRSEIQSIMDQFGEEGTGPGHEEVMSPRLEFAGPHLSSPLQHPPRKSSLEPLNVHHVGQSLGNVHISSSSPNAESQFESDVGPAVPPKPKPGSISSFKASRMPDNQSEYSLSPGLHRPPPPEPEPEPDLPFDFHRFLEQLRHRTADPVAKFLRSFLQEFGKKQWMVHEQVKIISDFLAFITTKMEQCDVWREVSDAEFDNAREGMEKLVMNRLYTQTFSPEIPLPQPIPGSRPKRRGVERAMGPGRRGQHQEDVERDDILAQKVSIYGWIREEHLDIQPVGDSGKRFLVMAQQEIRKIKTYRAPRDKIICVLNCCKVIFGLLKHSKTDSSADSFMPLLIYVVLQANPEHLVSNVQYILRFRNQDKLSGEAGYYLSSLLGAVQFIESLDRTTLTISDEDFEKNVEAAVSAIAEKHEAEAARTTSPTFLSDKAGPSQPEVTPRHSMEGESSTPRKSTSSNENENSGDPVDEKAAMSGLLRSIQRPLTSIGRMFSEDQSTSGQGNTPRPNSATRTSLDGLFGGQQRSTISREHSTRSRLGAEEAAARQESVDNAEAVRIQRKEHTNVVGILVDMFPNLDRDVISDIVIQKEGRTADAVDACLALNS